MGIHANATESCCWTNQTRMNFFKGLRCYDYVNDVKRLCVNVFFWFFLAEDSVEIWVKKTGGCKHLESC